MDQPLEQMALATFNNKTNYHLKEKGTLVKQFDGYPSQDFP